MIYNVLLLLSLSLYGQINANQYTPEEVLKLKQFRELNSEVLEKVNAHMKSDGYLNRFLTAKEMDVKAASEMLRNTIDWRKENDIDNILNEELPQDFTKRPFFQVGEIYDKEGRPVSTFEIKKMDVRKFVLGGQASQFVRLWHHIYESVESKLANSTGSPSQATHISDMQDYNLRQHACIACIQPYIEETTIYEKHFPGLFRKIILINAPRILTPLLDILRPYMSPGTKNALVVYGNDKAEWQQALLQLIDSDQLPQKYGGTKA